MRKIGLMTVMMILALVAVDITVSIGGDYKDFSWGDDILKVKAKVPDLEERPFAVFFVAVLGAYVVQYGIQDHVRLPGGEAHGRRRGVLRRKSAPESGAEIWDCAIQGLGHAWYRIYHSSLV